jgi:hypothetical protein
MKIAKIVGLCLFLMLSAGSLLGCSSDSLITGATTLEVDDHTEDLSVKVIKGDHDDSSITNYIST